MIKYGAHTGGGTEEDYGLRSLTLRKENERELSTFNFNLHIYIQICFNDSRPHQKKPENKLNTHQIIVGEWV